MDPEMGARVNSAGESRAELADSAESDNGVLGFGRICAFAPIKSGGHRKSSHRLDKTSRRLRPS